MSKLSKEAREAGFTEKHVKQMSEFLRKLANTENEGKIVKLRMTGKAKKKPGSSDR